MSFATRRGRSSLPITQRDIKTEVAHCVGGVASPVMSNIYLDRLDRFVEQRLLPEYDHGRRRRPNRAYRLLGFAGPKHEAEDIKSRIAVFLREELKWELSQSKTLITHATSQAARFLGYDIRAQHCDTKITRNRRAVNAAIGLFVPKTVIRQRCALYMQKGKPAQRGALLHDDDFTIVAKYGAEYAGLVQYYLLAQDVFRPQRLRWVMESSMLKTLTGKHRSTVAKMARKYKTTIDTPTGSRTVFQVQVQVQRDRGRKPLVARFGEVPLKRVRTAVLTDQRPVMASARRNELIRRLLAGGRGHSASGGGGSSRRRLTTLTTRPILRYVHMQNRCARCEHGECNNAYGHPNGVATWPRSSHWPTRSPSWCATAMSWPSKDSHT